MDTREPAANLRARAELMRRIAAIIQPNGWKQVAAAARAGVTQPRNNERAESSSARQVDVAAATATNQTLLAYCMN
jgi:predicted XRE-type DNA-binding protein